MHLSWGTQGMHRSHVVNRLIEATGARTYLEIGVLSGECFRMVRAQTKVAVDPSFEMPIPEQPDLTDLLEIPPGEHYLEMESDSFFERHRDLLDHHPIDVAFIDGLHEADQVWRDIENCLRHISEGGIVALHDCNPRTAVAAAPTQAEAMQMPGYTGEWNGDVYRAMLWTRRRFPDLGVCVLDTDYGVGMISHRIPFVPLDDDIGDDIDYEGFRIRACDVLNLRPAQYLEELVSRW